jgi:hypothetical protein
MMPMSFEAAGNHPYSVRVTVTGGQDTEAVGRPHIPNLAFTQALIQSIRESQIFSSVIEGQSKGENYLLRVTLFSIDKRAFGKNRQTGSRLELGTGRYGDHCMARSHSFGIY